MNAACEGSVGEAGGELVAGGELGDGADYGAVGGKDRGVAAVEDGERRERVEARVEGAESGCGACRRRSRERSRRARQTASRSRAWARP